MSGNAAAAVLTKPAFRKIEWLVRDIAVELVIAILGWTHGGRHAFTGTREISAILPTLLLVQAFTMPGQDSWNIQSWSISVELWLYVVWALAWRLIGRGAIALTRILGASVAAM